MQTDTSGTGSDAEDRTQQVAMDCLQLLSLLEVVSHHEPADLTQLQDAGQAATRLLHELPTLSCSGPLDAHRQTVARLVDAQSKAEALQLSATLKARAKLSSHLRLASFAESAHQLGQACEQLRLWIEQHDAALLDVSAARDRQAPAASAPRALQADPG